LHSKKKQNKNNKDLMKQFLYLTLSLLMTGITTGIIRGAEKTSIEVEDHEIQWLKLNKKPAGYIQEVYGKFKKACAENNFNIIQTMLDDKQLPPHEIGCLVLGAFDEMKKQCLEKIASHHPYAVWDSYLNFDHHPYPSNKFIKKCLDVGFMFPYKRADSNHMCTTMVPVLHYFLMFREWKKGVAPAATHTQNPDLMEDVVYETIEKLLQSGANTHYIDYFGVHKEPQNAFTFTTDTAKPEEGPKLKALLDKYTRTVGTIDKMEVLLCTPQYPLDILDQIFILAHNTTDMFHPGTKFYREKI
jgi:hypothetical protein